MGLGLLGLVLPSASGALATWPASLFVGMTTWTLASIAAAGAGWDLPVWSLWISGITLLIVSLLRSRRHGGGVRRPIARRVRAFVQRSGTQFAALVLGIFVVFEVVMLRGALVRPVRDWDSWAFWILKARALAAPDGLSSPVFGSGLYHHLEYPIFVPALWRNAWGLMDGWSTPASQVQMVFLQAACAGVAFVCIRRVGPAWAAALGALVFATCPALVMSLPTLYADVPLALAGGAVTLSALAWYRAPSTDLLLIMGLAVAMLVSTKSEGLLIFVTLLLPLAALILPRHRRQAIWWIAAMVGGLLPYVVWRLAISGVPIRADYELSRLLDPPYLVDNADRAQMAAGELLRLVTAPPLVSMLAVGLMGLFVGILLGEWRMPAMAVSTLALALSGFTAIYAISDLGLDWYLTTSASRVTIAPLFILAVTGVFVAVDRLSAARSVAAREGPKSSSASG